jgi:hypothetical protein
MMMFQGNGKYILLFAVWRVNECFSGLANIRHGSQHPDQRTRNLKEGIKQLPVVPSCGNAKQKTQTNTGK